MPLITATPAAPQRTASPARAGSIPAIATTGSGSSEHQYARFALPCGIHGIAFAAVG
jgi:hypothetical protein